MGYILIIAGQTEGVTVRMYTKSMFITPLINSFSPFNSESTLLNATCSRSHYFSFIPFHLVSFNKGRECISDRMNFYLETLRRNYDLLPDVFEKI